MNRPFLIGPEAALRAYDARVSQISSNSLSETDYAQRNVQQKLDGSDNWRYCLIANRELPLDDFPLQVWNWQGQVPVPATMYLEPGVLAPLAQIYADDTDPDWYVPPEE
jgi:hypothetical protein